LVEQLLRKQLVGGSNPLSGTTKLIIYSQFHLCGCHLFGTATRPPLQLTSLI
jgi:hypothetical protein